MFLQENDMKKIGGMAKGFGGAIKGIVQGIKEGIDLFSRSYQENSPSNNLWLILLMLLNNYRKRFVFVCDKIIT